MKKYWKPKITFLKDILDLQFKINTINKYIKDQYGGDIEEQG